MSRAHVRRCLLLTIAVLSLATSACGDSESDSGDCLSNAECLTEEYCERPIGLCEGVGSCAAIPEACTLEFAPVCGCDEQSYSNSCAAAAAGQSIMSEGECPSGAS